jgi:ribosomal protein S4
MAELKLFTPEELAERSKPKRQQKREAKERMISEYAHYLAAARPGYAGEVLLGEGDDKRHLRALLKEAGQRNNQQLRFRPIKDANRIEFHLVEPEKKSRGAGKTTGGRRKKQG